MSTKRILALLLTLCLALTLVAPSVAYAEEPCDHDTSNFVVQKEATCMSPGRIQGICPKCHIDVTIETEPNPNAHNYVNGECTYCHKSETQPLATTPVLLGNTTSGVSMDDAVAVMGDVYYGTLADAYQAVLTNGGGEIKLLKDTSGAGIGCDGDAGVTYTIDFDGHTYTCTERAVGSKGTESQAFRVINGQNVTLKNGTFTCTNTAGVYMLFHIYGNLVLDSMTIDGSNMPGSGLYTLSYCLGNSVIKGNTVIKVVNNGTAFDVDGAYAKKNNGTVAVTFDETFGGTVNGIIEYNYAEAGRSTLTINGNGNFANATITDNSGDANPALTITGGSFATDPSAYIAEGKEVCKSANKYLVQAAGSAAAECNGVKYLSVQDALNEAASGNTVKLLKNVDSRITVYSDDEVVLDLNGFELTNASNDDAVIYNYGNLTIQDTSDGADGKITGDTYAVAVFTNSTITVNSGTLEATEPAIVIGWNTGVTVNVNGGTLIAADNAAIMDNGTAGYGGNTINITGGTITGSIRSDGYGSFGIYLANNDVLNISGGTITGANVPGRAGAGIVMRAGELNISGGTIRGLGDTGATGKYGDSTVLTGSYGIDVDFASNYPGYKNGQLKLTITGGTIKGTDGAIRVYGEPSANGLIAISGGTFTNNNGAKSELSPGYIVNGYVQNEQGTVTAHTHDYIKGEWAWTFSNGNVDAVRKDICQLCGEVQVVKADSVETTEIDNKNVYSVFLHGEKVAEYRQVKTIDVSVGEGSSDFTGAGTASSGAVVTVRSTVPVKWTVQYTGKEPVVVSNRAESYSFIARENVTVTASEADAKEEPTFFATLAAQTVEGQARFEAGWAMPNGYRIVNAYFYRATATDNSTMTQQQMLVSGKRASITLKNQFATYGANLKSSSASYYNTMLVVTYKDAKGATHTFYSEVLQAKIR